MKLLPLYLMRQNLFLVLTVLLVGTGLYLLTDLFDRMDEFLDAGIGLSGMLLYFAVKTPSIISQILPAVFLLALVVQLNILERSRELVAIQAGGISYLVLVRFILIYGLVWSGGQLFFSQVAGVQGDRIAGRIWQEEVRGKDLAKRTQVRGLWFTDRDRVLRIGQASPQLKTGTDLLVYDINPAGTGIDAIIQAASFTIHDDFWLLRGVTRLLPASFVREQHTEYRLPITEDLKAFQATESSFHASQLPLWEFGDVIERLQSTGSNVEALRTQWHGKLAYAFSLVVMGLLGLMLSQLTPNVYKAVGGALLCVFLFHALNTFCSSMGEKGILSPPAGAWFADIFVFSLVSCWFVWPKLRQKLTQG